MPMLDHAAAQIGAAPERSGGLHGDELVATEREALLPRAGQIVEAVPQRVGLAVELEGSVIGHDAVFGELRGHEKGVDLVTRRVGTARDRRIEPPPQVQQPARGRVLLQHRGTGLPAPPGVDRDELVVAEHGVAREEVGGLDLPASAHTGI